MVKSETSISYEKKSSSSDLELIRNGIFTVSHLKHGLLKGEAFYLSMQSGYILYGCLDIDELYQVSN